MNLKYTDIHSACILVRNKYGARPLGNKKMKEDSFFGAAKMNSAKKKKKTLNLYLCLCLYNN